MADRHRAPRKRRRARAPHEDDRPRGHEPTRMRRLWQDIDQSRDKLGLGAAPSPNGTSWTWPPWHAWDTWSAWASGLVGGVGSPAGDVPTQIRAVVTRLPGSAAACRVVGETASDLVRRLPIAGPVVGGVLGLLVATVLGTSVRENASERERTVQR